MEPFEVSLNYRAGDLAPAIRTMLFRHRRSTFEALGLVAFFGLLSNGGVPDGIPSAITLFTHRQRPSVA